MYSIALVNNINIWWRGGGESRKIATAASTKNGDAITLSRDRVVSDRYGDIPHILIASCGRNNVINPIGKI